MTSQQTGGPTPTRRTLVKGAAWSVPVVAMAGAAPAMAASQDVTFTNLSLACKLPGASCEKETGVKKGYVVSMRLCTTVRETVSIDFGTATGLLCGLSKTWVVKPDPLVIPGSSDGTVVCSTVNISLDGEPDSANCAISGSAPYTWTSTNGLSGSGTMTFSAPATPPCDNCVPPVPAAATAATTSTGELAPPSETTVRQPAPATSTDEAATTAGPTG